jgi:bacillithiol system protein YtxJ
MSANFIKLESIGQLESLFEQSHEKAIVIFKHSNSCGISSDILEQAAAIDGDVNVVVIQENRDISQKIAEMTGHRHQSPQAFVTKDGRAIYHATHYGIDPEAIEGKLDH